MGTKSRHPPHWALVVERQWVDQTPAPVRAWRPLPVDCVFWGSAFCLFTGQDPEACSVGRAGPLASRGPGFRWQMASISHLYSEAVSAPEI